MSILSAGRSSPSTTVARTYPHLSRHSVASRRSILGKRRRIFERLDRKGGSERVEGIKGVQRLRFGFVGRRKERAEALRRWRRGERRLVVLGLGGLGKTALCTELAPLLARDLKTALRYWRSTAGMPATQPNPILALWQEVQAAGSGEAWSQTLANLQKDGVTGAALGQAVVELAKLKEGSWSISTTPRASRCRSGRERSDNSAIRSFGASGRSS